MNQPPTLPPDLVARADQMRAGCSEQLDTLIDEYRSVRADLVPDPNVAFSYLVSFLQDRLARDERLVVFTLAAAIERLA